LLSNSPIITSCKRLLTWVQFHWIFLFKMMSLNSWWIEFNSLYWMAKMWILKTRNHGMMIWLIKFRPMPRKDKNYWLNNKSNISNIYGVQILIFSLWIVSSIFLRFLFKTLGFSRCLHLTRAYCISHYPSFSLYSSNEWI